MTTQTNQQASQQAGQAQEKANQVKDSAQQSAQQLGQQTADAFKAVKDEDPVKGFVQIWERIPTNSYFMAAAGSILLSALLMLSGRQRAAIFVGQWPPTMIALALFNKLLRPSQEVS